MIKGVITFLDGKPAIGVTIGLGEDVKAPRDLAALEKSGWVIDDSITTAYKAWLAGKRQGDIDSGSKFETWVDNVAEVDLKLSSRQIETAVALGRMEREEADKLLAFFGSDSEGEAVARHDA